MKAYLQRLSRHAAWANDRVLILLQATVVSEREVTRLFSHLLTTERIYLARMRGDDPWPQEFWPELSLVECSVLATENSITYEQFIASLSEDQLMRAVRYRNSQGREFHTSIQDLLTHVMQHGAYHRGQIAAAIRRGGGDPVNTDFITFVRDEKR